MSSTAPVNLDAHRSAMPSILMVPLEHLESNNHFQQMLSVDSALEALSISRSKFKDKPQSLPFLGEQADADYDAGSLADLDMLLKTFGELQTRARHRFERQARSLRHTKIGIMDLPDEMLLSIFENLRSPLGFTWLPGNWLDMNSKGVDDVETIKNLRLTCLRFRRNSSHLLIRHLNVSPDISSLDFLEKVSSHPEISRGERILRLDLRYYSASEASDLRAFSAICCPGLQRAIAIFKAFHNEEVIREIQIQREDGGEEQKTHQSPLKCACMNSACKGITEIQRTLSIWERFSNGTPVEESDPLDTAVIILRKGHERYRELFQQQQRVIEDGSLARAIAKAVAASKSKIWLSMSDVKFNLSSDRRLFSNSDGLESILSSIEPQPWCHAEDATAGDVPQSLLCQVPLAIHTAEAKLAGFEVHIPYHCDKLDLSMSDEQLCSLQEVTKNLENFTFWTDSYSADGIDAQTGFNNFRNFQAYLCAAMSPRIAPNLSLSFGMRDHDPAGVEIPIHCHLLSSDWHGLKSALIGHVSVDFQSLRDFIDTLEPGTRLCLRDIYLKSGTWAAALDCLRSKAGCKSWLNSPRGAECDHMTDKQYHDIFVKMDDEDGGFERSHASRYITSVEGVENPFCKKD